MTVELEVHKNIVDLLVNKKTFDTIAVYFQEHDVWVFSTRATQNLNLEDLKNLFLEQVKPRKVIYLKLSLFELIEYGIGQEPTLNALFKRNKGYLLEENVEGLSEIAEILKEEFNKEEYIKTSKKRKLEELLNSVANLNVSFPEKLKEKDPFGTSFKGTKRLTKGGKEC